MDTEWRDQEAASRLLYDDERPRLRRPVNPTVLKLRRPAFLVMPLVFALACIGPSFGVAYLAADLLPVSETVLASGLSGFMALTLLLTLALARRQEKSFALLIPNALSVSHALLIVTAGALFAVPSLLAAEPVAAVLSSLPGPALEEPPLQLAKAYIGAFLLVTGVSIGAVVVFRILGLRRVVAEGA
ncbi:hypothetical protein [Parvularcula maris]|uniref:Uncharacterized protein n=1 Tax=Parvularcula maris TaxID=2965077 RepID=A0A9X2RHI0_9PROT|nr:hypothetical protein [Parvularcula maris]MCQ8184965.1 hypothetical protein [Parvularcula maris]